MLGAGGSGMMAGQTINDRLLAARHSLAGQGLAKSVCKATTEELIGPKKKHLDYLVHCTNEPNVSIPQLANLLIERSQNANWVVVYKALITVHHLLAYGNERFMQYLASSNSTFNLSNFLDKGGVQGAVGARIGYDMSPFIRRYAKYLNEKALSYRTVAFDFCKVKRGKEEGSLRTMNADKLLKTLPVLQAQLDGLLEFDCSANDLTNGVINMCFMLLFRDLIRLFACYNDGIINLLEKYFDMNKKQCRDALDLYKKFLVRMDRVGEFLKVAENVGIDKGDIPDLTKAPSSLLDALEQHLATLEGRKGSAANTPTQSASNQKNVKTGVSALSSTSSSFGTAAASTRLDSHSNGVIDESIKAQALAEEEAAMNQYKSKLQSPTGGVSQLTNPFLSSPTGGQSSTAIVDLFGVASGGAGHGVGGIDQSAGAANSKASDDLLQLGNPFADMFGGPPAQTSGGGQSSVPGGANNSPWLSNGFNGSAAGVAPNQTAVPANTFVSDSNFSTVFGNTEPATIKLENPFLLAEDEFIQSNDQIQDSSVQQTATSTAAQQFQHQQQGELVEQQQNVQQLPENVVTVGDPDDAIVKKKHEPLSYFHKNAVDDLDDSIRTALGTPRKMSLTGGIAVGSPGHNNLPAYGMTIGNVGYQQYHQQTSQHQVMQQQAPMSAGSGQQQMFSSSSSSSVTASPVAKELSSTSASLIGEGFDALGDVLKPASSAGQQQQTTGLGNQAGNLLASGAAGQIQQQQQQHPQSSANTGKIFTGDLDSSLASLVDNLNINKSSTTKGVQWNSPKNAAKPGANWQPQPMAATTGAGYRPMAQGMTVSPAPSTLNHPYVHTAYPVLPTYLQQGIPQMQPAPGIAQIGQTGGAIIQQQPSTHQSSAQNGNKSVQLDPFGAL